MAAADAATRRLYERILAIPGNRALARAIEGGRDPVGESGSDLLAAARSRPRIVLVPGIFYRDYPHTGADGDLLRQIAAELSIPFDVIALDGSGGLEEAARAIGEWLLAAGNERPILLCSLSKGSAEVRVALTLPTAPRVFAAVTTWVSVSGLPLGTPGFALALENPLRRLFIHTWFALKGWDLRTIAELLRHTPELRVDLPGHLHLVQVVAFPLQEHLRDRRSRRLRARLAHLGPNDGFALLEELAALPGLLYPVWGADHYLRGIPDLRERITRLVRHLARTACGPANL